MPTDYQEIIQRIKQFRDERDWKQFHNHKDMAVSVCLEAAELLEHFQWKDKEQVEEYVKAHREDISDEIADVAIYLFELADNMGINVLEAMEKKIQINEQHYPVERVKGNNKKYTEYS